MISESQDWITLPETRIRSALLIGNPAAAGGRARARLPSLCEAFARTWPGRIQIVWTSAPGDAERLAAAARERGVALVVVAGGDGTVHEVVNGLLQGRSQALEPGGTGPVPELAILPIGTGCDFARSLGIAPDPKKAVAAMATHPARSVDVGWGRLRRGNSQLVERAFVNAANMGLGSRVVEGARGSLSRTGRFRYVLAALGALAAARPTGLDLTVDGHPVVRRRWIHLSICNGPSFGGGMQLAGEAALDDARLHWVGIGALSPVAALIRLPALFAGTFDHPALERGRGVYLKVGDAPWLVEMDGEIVGGLPGEFSLQHNALRVRAPR